MKFDFWQTKPNVANKCHFKHDTVQILRHISTMWVSGFKSSKVKFAMALNLTAGSHMQICSSL